MKANNLDKGKLLLSKSDISNLYNILNELDYWLIFVSDDLNIVDCNETVFNDLKIERTDTVGKHLWSLPIFHANQNIKKKVSRLIELAKKGEKNRFEESYISMSGHKRLMECMISPMVINDKKYILLESRDITHFKKVFSIFDKLEFDYQEIFERCSAGLCILKSGRIVAMNESFASMLQLDDKCDFEAMNPAGISPEYQPDGKRSTEKSLEMLEISAKNGTHQFEWLHKRRDGTEFMVDVHLISLGEDSDVSLAVWHDISESKKREEKLLLLKSELEKLVKERTAELENSITEIKFMQEKLIESRKLTAMSGLVKGLSHEISTPIGTGLTTASFIDMCINRLIEDIESNKLTRKGLNTLIYELKEGITSINSSLKKASDLINAFKELDKDSTVKKVKSIELYKSVEEAIACFSSEIKRLGINVNVIVPRHIRFFGDSVAMYLIFENLISNSLSHGFTDVEQGEISITAEAQEDFIDICYSDNGHGMSEEMISKIFDPFFTTKRARGHLGIGMSIVYNQVQQCEGEITVSSPDNEGIEVNVRLPVKCSE